MSLLEVDSLLQLCLWKVIDFFGCYTKEIIAIPVHLKTRLLDILSKRGLINDANINLLLSEDVRSLDMSHTDVTDSALYDIAKFCPYLVKIDLNSYKCPRLGISSLGIAQLALNCKYIQAIYLRHCIEITDSGIEDLVKSCKNLRELNLGNCPLISDYSLSAIGQKCTKLISLNLSKTSITDVGIFKVVNGLCAGTLQEVHVDNCLHITDDSVTALVNLCPNLSILIFHNCPNITEQSRLELEAFSSTMKKHVTFTVY